MRICFISHSAELYGAEIALVELLKGLIKLNVVCLVIVPKSGPLLKELDDLNIQWIVIKYPPWISRKKKLLSRIVRTLKTVYFGLKVARLIEQWNCHLVYTNTVCVSVGALAAWLAGKPHVWHSHESGEYNADLRFDLGLRTVMWLMERLSVAIIVVSRSLQNDYAPYIRANKIYLIYQSVTPRYKTELLPVRNAPNNPLRCVMVGSVQRWKGQEEAIKAIAELTRRGINTSLTIVGDGPKQFRLALDQQVKANNIMRQVRFVGYAEDPTEYIRSADVALVCSRWEAFGRVTVEGMLAAKPTVATANGGTAELIVDGETGLFYESGNYVQLADKIQYLYENPAERARLSKAAYAWAVGRFTQERYANDVFNLLSTMANSGKPSGDTPLS